jgi:hypothetical protein
MGLFAKLRGTQEAASPEYAVWQPVGEPQEEDGDDAAVDDDGQVSDIGYWCTQSVFQLPGDPYSWIELNVYVCYVGDDGYGIGARYIYARSNGWRYTGYEGDPEREVFDTVQDAQASAQEWAASLAAEDDRSRVELPGVFDWDGTPFQVDDEE